MPLPKTVTAQDFLDEIYNAGPGNVSEPRFHHEKAWEEDLKPLWDALLSSVRQEARREALKEMDMACGLMLMDLGVYTGSFWSANYGHMLHLDPKAYLFKLRQEYQQPN